jgi:hypothetical protein
MTPPTTDTRAARRRLDAPSRRLEGAAGNRAATYLGFADAYLDGTGDGEGAHLFAEAGTALRTAHRGRKNAQVLFSLGQASYDLAKYKLREPEVYSGLDDPLYHLSDLQAAALEQAVAAYRAAVAISLVEVDPSNAAVAFDKAVQKVPLDLRQGIIDAAVAACRAAVEGKMKTASAASKVQWTAPIAEIPATTGVPANARVAFSRVLDIAPPKLRQGIIRRVIALLKASFDESKKTDYTDPVKGETTTPPGPRGRPGSRQRPPPPEPGHPETRPESPPLPLEIARAAETLAAYFNRSADEVLARFAAPPEPPFEPATARETTARATAEPHLSAPLPAAHDLAARESLSKIPAAFQVEPSTDADLELSTEQVLAVVGNSPLGRLQRRYHELLEAAVMPPTTHEEAKMLGRLVTTYSRLRKRQEELNVQIEPENPRITEIENARATFYRAGKHRMTAGD